MLVGLRWSKSPGGGGYGCIFRASHPMVIMTSTVFFSKVECPSAWIFVGDRKLSGVFITFKTEFQRSMVATNLALCIGSGEFPIYFGQQEILFKRGVSGAIDLSNEQLPKICNDGAWVGRKNFQQ